MLSDTKAVDVLSSSRKVTHAELILWDEDGDDPDMVKLSLRSLEREITKVDTDFFAALCSIRAELEKESLLLDCYGASRNVYPSTMIRSMGTGDKAYKLYMRQPAKQEDIVSIFDTGSDVLPTTVSDQEEYYKEWLRSLGGS